MGTRGTLITQADGAQAVTGRRRQGRRGARGASRPKRPEAPEARVAIYIVKSLFFEKNCAVKWLEWTIVENLTSGSACLNQQSAAGFQFSPTKRPVAMKIWILHLNVFPLLVYTSKHILFFTSLFTLFELEIFGFLFVHPHRHKGKSDTLLGREITDQNQAY